MGGNGTVVYFLFNIKEDPTETENLACSETAKMSDMLKFYANYSSTAVVGLSWKYGFRDPAASHTYGGCAGPYEGRCVHHRELRLPGSSATHIATESGTCIIDQCSF
eukprot:gene3325-3826_t